MPHPEALKSLAALLHLPGFVFGHLRYITTNAVADAPVATGTAAFPVLVGLQGRGGYRQESTVLIEELVSHGFVVAALDEPYAASGVVFPDGRTLRLDPRMLDRAFVDGSVPYLAQDVSFALDRLGDLNRGAAGSPLSGRMDLGRIGVFGLSLGGQVSAEASLVDRRISACISMDVWMPADVRSQGLKLPTLFLTRDAGTMRLEGWSAADIAETLGTVRSAFDRLPTDGFLVQVPGMFHQDFSDAPLLSPLEEPLGIAGPIGAERARQVVCACALDFFDRYVKGRDIGALVSFRGTFPWVAVEVHVPRGP